VTVLAVSPRRLPLADYVRLYAPHGKLAHLSPPWAWREVLCRPDGSRQPQAWLGTGSQDEYDRAASLPLCGRCALIWAASPHQAVPS
jgi:hypothetical protein